MKDFERKYANQYMELKDLEMKYANQYMEMKDLEMKYANNKDLGHDTCKLARQFFHQ